jgi:hypothetical protein
MQPRNGHRSQPPAPGPAGSALTTGHNQDGVTQNQGASTIFRCGGCGATAVFVQRERRYGRLVHGFFGQHERCPGAVDISAARPPAPAPPPGTSQAPGSGAQRAGRLQSPRRRPVAAALTPASWDSTLAQVHASEGRDSQHYQHCHPPDGGTGPGYCSQVPPSTASPAAVVPSHQLTGMPR